MRRLRSIILRILAAGLMGVVVTVGVAVGCGISSCDGPVSIQHMCYWKETGKDEVFVWRDWKHSWGTRMGTAISLGEWWGYPRDGTEIVSRCPVPRAALTGDFKRKGRVVRAAGWPCLAAWGSVEFDNPGVEDCMGVQVQGPTDLAVKGAIGIGRPLCFTDDHGLFGYLPIGPNWSGLAINTLFYGTIAWLLLLLPGTLRRWRRVRAGRCVKCGYDRAGLAAGAACPECGGAAAL